MSDTFEKTLGINSVPKVIDITPTETVVLPEQTEESLLPKDAQDDYNLSRETFRSIITTGNNAVQDITSLAKFTDNPEAYKALAVLIKTVSEATKDLYNIHKVTKELKSLDGTGKKILDNGNVNIDKAVFVGTTTDLLRTIKDQDNNG